MFGLMDTTESLSKVYNTTPFDIMVQDAEHVIMVINYLVDKADEMPDDAENHESKPKKQKDSFWDF